MAIDDLEAPDDERAVELASIQAIFPELVLDSVTNESHAAHIDLEVNLLAPLIATFAAPRQDATGLVPASPVEAVPLQTDTEPPLEHAPGGYVELTHLPSIRCDISLPETYPETSPPGIRLYCDVHWLSSTRLRELERQVHSHWVDAGKNVMLFDYLDWALTLAQQAFGLLEVPNPVTFPRDLETSLLDFDLQAKRADFERQTFDCGVCLEPRKGVACHKMADCGHVFCKNCLHDFYKNCVTEGDVANVKCMNPGCGKERLQHLPEKKRRKADLSLKAGELVAIGLDSTAVQRYIQMKRKKVLEADKTTIYCPRKWCQGAARSQKTDDKSDDDADSEPDDQQTAPDFTSEKPFGERLAICSDCSFAFCSRCLNGWHGEHIMCHPPRNQQELSKEEKATQAYLLAHSTRCPTCDSPVQKTMGCNHMLCQLCRTHFCYLCSAYLMPDNPYAHYNRAGQGCYQKLWVLEGGDFDGAPDQFPVDNVANIPPEVEHAGAPVDVAAPAAPIHEEDRARVEAILDAIVVFEDDSSSSEENEVAPPPPAPVPPARGRGRRQGPGGNRGRGAARGRERGRGGRGGGRRGQEPRARAPAPAPAAGNVRPPLPAHEQNALQRFLRLAQQDMEDEWDSDELDSDDDANWAIPMR